MLKYWKNSGAKVWQSRFNEIIKLIIRNSLIKRLSNFHVVFPNGERRTYVAAVKSEKLKVFIIIYYNISKSYSVQFHLFYSVNLSHFYFFIHGFQSSILHKFKNTLNRWLKLNKDNNLSFLVAYTTSIPASKHNYLIYKSKQYKSCNLKLVKYKLQKIFFKAW